jgi:hypothetical protein
MRRAIKVLLLILTLLLAIASAGIVITLLILEWPRAANTRDDVAKHRQLSGRKRLTPQTSKPRCSKARAEGRSNG